MRVAFPDDIGRQIGYQVPPAAGLADSAAPPHAHKSWV